MRYQWGWESVHRWDNIGFVSLLVKLSSKRGGVRAPRDPGSTASSFLVALLA